MEKIGSIAPFGLRMEKPLREALEKAAKSSGRSLNAEVIARLNESLAVIYDQRPRRARAMVSEPDRLPAEEELLLGAFRALDGQRQLAFIAFLRALQEGAPRPKRRIS